MPVRDLVWLQPSVRRTVGVHHIPAGLVAIIFIDKVIYKPDAAAWRASRNARMDPVKLIFHGSSFLVASS